MPAPEPLFSLPGNKIHPAPERSAWGGPWRRLAAFGGSCHKWFRTGPVPRRTMPAPEPFFSLPGNKIRPALERSAWDGPWRRLAAFGRSCHKWFRAGPVPRRTMPAPEPFFSLPGNKIHPAPGRSAWGGPWHRLAAFGGSCHKWFRAGPVPRRTMPTPEPFFPLPGNKIRPAPERSAWGGPWRRLAAFGGSCQCGRPFPPGKIWRRSL